MSDYERYIRDLGKTDEPLKRFEARFIELAEIYGRRWTLRSLGEPDEVVRRDLPPDPEGIPPEMIHALLLLCYHQRGFTPRQAEALHLTFVEGLTQREAAAASRYQPCSRESYGKRLAAARRHAVTILRAAARLPQADGVVRRPSEVRRGRNRGR